MLKTLSGLILAGIMSGSALVLLLCLTGCQHPAPPEGITATPLAEEDLDPLWEVALSLLRKHGFQPDRQG